MYTRYYAIVVVALVMLATNQQRAGANSIKGYSRQRDDASRSVRLSPANTIERPGRVYGADAQQQQQQQQQSPAAVVHSNGDEYADAGKASPVAALESTKRLYQEEMSRRQQLAQLHQQQLAAVAAIRPVEELKREKVVVTAPVVHSEEPVARDGAVLSAAPAVVEQTKHESAPVVAQASPPVPVVVESAPAASAPVVQAQAAPVVAEPVAVPQSVPQAVESPAKAAVAEPVAKSSADPVAPVIVPVSARVVPIPAVAAAPEPDPVVVPIVVVVQRESSVEQKKAAEEKYASKDAEQKKVEPAAAAAVEAKKGPVAEEKPQVEAKKQADSGEEKLQQRSGAEAGPAVVPAPVVPVSQSAPVAVEQPVPVKVNQVESAPVVSAPVVPAAVSAPPPQVVEAKSSGDQSSFVDEQLSAKKNAQEQSIYAPIEVPAPDPGLVLSEPIDSTTKLLINLDEDVAKFLSSDDSSSSSAPAQPHQPVSGIDYASALASPVGAEHQQQQQNPAVKPSIYSSGDNEPIVPPLPSLVGVEQAAAPGVVAAAAAPSAGVVSSAASDAAAPASRQGSSGQSQQQVLGQLIDQLDALYARIQDTNNQLIARRRYVMSALLRPMGTYVRRVRTNLDRLQNRVMALQSAAVSIGGGNNNGQRPNGFVDAAAIDAIRRRIDDISKRISDIVNRIRFSLTPTSAPLNNGR